MTLGQRLKAAREAANYTQKELAVLLTERTGLKWRAQSVSDAECDRPHFPWTYHLLASWYLACHDGPHSEIPIIDWCALAGLCHPVIKQALSSPDFARRVYRQAMSATK